MFSVRLEVLTSIVIISKTGVKVFCVVAFSFLLLTFMSCVKCLAAFPYKCQQLPRTVAVSGKVSP